jgi:predicted DNA-binding transcriptional regulator AlpA
MPPRDKSVNAALAAHARAAKSVPLAQFPPHELKKGERLLLRNEMLDRVRLSYQKVWRMMRDGVFPRSVNLGVKVAWYESEVDVWLASLKRTKLKGDEEVA